jgi:hypothetical protein
MDWLLTNHEAIRNLGLVVVAAIGLPVAIWRSWIAEKLSIAAQEQSRTTAENHLAETYTRAINQIGSNETEIRFGGFYALEKIANSNLGYYKQA